MVGALDIQLDTHLDTLLQLTQYAAPQLDPSLIGLPVILVPLYMFLHELEIDLDRHRGIPRASTFNQQERPRFQHLILLTDLDGLIQGEHVLPDLSQDLPLLPCDR